MSPAGATMRIDWLGLILVSSGIVAVAYAVDRAGEWGWSSPKLIGLLALAVALSGPLAGRLAGWQPVSVLIPATMLFGGASLLATSRTRQPSAATSPTS